MAPHAAPGLAALLLDPRCSSAADLIASSSSSSSSCTTHHLGLSLLDAAGALGVDARLSAVSRAVAAAADALANSTRASADAAASPSPSWDWVPGFSSSDHTASSSGGGAWSGGCPAGFGASVGKLKRYPPVAVPSTWSLLTPQQLLWLFLKNTGIVFLLQTNMWLYQALEAEEAALQQGTQATLPPYPDVLQQLVKAGWASWRELLTRITRSELKHWINRSASSRTAWKVLKDPRESLAAKAVFYSATPALRLLPMYTTTMFRTQLPTYAAELIVACGYDAVAELQALVKLPPLPVSLQQPQPQSQPGGAERERGSGPLAALSHAQAVAAVRLQAVLGGQAALDWAALPAASRRFWLRTAKHLLRVAGTAVCAAAGAGVAGALAPRESTGTWAFRGLIVSDLVFANVFLLLLDGPLAGAFEDEAAAAAAKAAAQQHQAQQHIGMRHAGTDIVHLFQDRLSG